MSDGERQSQRAAGPDGLVLLHLSDLHFGNKNRFQGRDLMDLGAKFSQAVERAREELSWSRPVDLIVVSGDIAEVARPREFEDGRTFLTALVQGLNLGPERTIFVPGNHDVSWPRCKQVDQDREIEEFNEAEYTKRLNVAKFEFYRRFLQQFYGLSDANLTGLLGRTLLDPASGAYLHDFTIEGLPVSFAALNTSEKETHKVQGGELGKAPAQALIKLWTSTDYAQYLKVAIVHHNPIATPPENRAWTEEWLKKKAAEKGIEATPDWIGHYLADMAGFKGAEWLQRIVHDANAHLVLHGHHHNPTAPVMWKRRVAGVAPILSVGSFGLYTDIPPDQPQTCQLIFFQARPEPRLIAVTLEYDSNYRPIGELDKGQFRLNIHSEAAYNDALHLPGAWKQQSHEQPDRASKVPSGPSVEVVRFESYYRDKATFRL